MDHHDDGSTAEQHRARHEVALDQIEQRVAELAGRAATSSSPDLVDALAHLEQTIEELHVSLEDLHDKHEKELATRAELEAERRHFGELFESAPDAYLLTTATGVVRAANRRARELLGDAALALVGRPIASLVAPEDRRGFRRRLAAAARDEVQRDWTFATHGRGAASILASADVSPGKDNDGQPELRWVLRDVTRDRAAQQALEDHLSTSRSEIASLQEQVRWKDAFLAAAAHDLRTPLSVILTSTETLLMRPDTDGDRRIAMLEMTRHHAHRLRRLVDDLLDLDRFVRGAVRPDRSRVSLRPLVDRALEGVDLGGRHVDIEVDDAEAWLDAVRVEQIVTNLVHNACTHTPPGTAIRVRLRADDAVVLTVEDDGPGLLPAIAERAFDPFVTQAVGGQEGTGLGLTLVRLFAELHGGTATAGAADGGGARFVVTLPTVDPA